MYSRAAAVAAEDDPARARSVLCNAQPQSVRPREKAARAGWLAGFHLTALARPSSSWSGSGAASHAMTRLRRTPGGGGGAVRPVTLFRHFLVDEEPTCSAWSAVSSSCFSPPPPHACPSRRSFPSSVVEQSPSSSGLAVPAGPPPPPLTAELEWASREGPARRSAAASWGEGQTKRLGLSLGDAGSFGGQGG